MKNPNNKKNKIKIVITSLLIVFLTVLIVDLVFIYSKNNDKELIASTIPTVTTTLTPEIADYEIGESELQQIREEYTNDKSVNDDIRCILVFKSGIIHEPVVQGTTNETYLRTNWETLQYDEVGSLFMDYEDIFGTSQNTIIYGHYVYESYSTDRTIMFTPLELLKQQENYESNKYFALVTDTNVTYYQVAYIAEVPLNGDYPLEGMNWMYPDYDAEYLNNYINLFKNYEFYETGVTITPDDKFVTLQTCVENHDEERFIVLAKQIN